MTKKNRIHVGVGNRDWGVGSYKSPITNNIHYFLKMYMGVIDKIAKKHFWGTVRLTEWRKMVQLRGKWLVVSS